MQINRKENFKNCLNYSIILDLCFSFVVVLLEYDIIYIQPSFDYYDYDIFIKRQGVYSDIPSTLKETFRLFRNALIYSFFIVVVYPRWSLESLLTEEFSSSNLLYKILWFNLTITLHRTKYVSGWLFSESGLAAAGFTYNG